MRPAITFLNIQLSNSRNDVKGKNLSLNSYKNVKNLRMDFN